jgi:hypothetical protein
LAVGTGRGMIFEQVLIFIRDHNFTIRSTKKWWTDQKGAATILSDGLVVSSWSYFMCFSAKYTLSSDKTEDNIIAHVKVCFLTASEMYHEEARKKDHSDLSNDVFIQKPITTHLIREINKKIDST